jgi:hyperosmotically inducible protein
MPTAEKIKKDVIDQLYWDHRIDASEVQVTVEDSTVELKGKVPSYLARAAATNDTWMVEGVGSVNNKMVVEYEPKVTLPTDSEIRAYVEENVRWNTSLPQDKIQVSVENRWVTLEGTVDAFWKKIIAEEDVSEVLGVAGVHNKLAVVPTERISDQRIAEDVVNALDRDIRVMTEDTNVEVENGIVTLSGTVPSWTAKSAAYNAALYTYGVIDVVDNTTVLP